MTVDTTFKDDESMKHDEKSYLMSYCGKNFQSSIVDK